MWIDRLEVQGFRRIAGTFEFSPALTLVVGDNEAGKSTLHDALLRTLFGFSGSERRRIRGTSLRERCAPWSGSPYGLIALVRNGENSLRIEWDFDAHRVRLLDDFGTDLSHEVRGRRDEVTLGEYLVGVGIEDFRHVCCIDQDALLAVRHSPTLAVALLEAVANVAGEIPVEEAIERLNDFLRSAIGAKVDTLKPSPTGRLSSLQRQRAELRAELLAAEDARAQLREISSKRARAREKHNALMDEREALRQTLLFSEVGELEQKLGEAQRLEAVALDRRDDVPSVDSDAIDAVKIALHRLGALDDELDESRRQAREAQSGLEPLEHEQADLVAVVDGLSPYGDVDVSARERVQTGWAELKALETERQEDAPHIPERDPLLEQYRTRRDGLGARAISSEVPAVRRALWILLVVLTLGVAWLVRYALRRRRGSGDLRVDASTAYSGASIEELDARVAEEDRVIAQAEALAAAFHERRTDVEHRRYAMRSQLEEALDNVGAPPGPLEQRVTAYLVAVERYAARAEKEVQLERIRRQILERKRPLDELQRVTRERDRAEQRLHDACRAVGIEAGADLAETIERFEHLVGEGDRAARTRQRADAAATALRSLLAGETIDDLEQRAANARRLFEDHRQRHGVLASEQEDLAYLRQRLEEVEQLLHGELEHMAGLETQVKQVEEDAGDPAELKEQLAEIDAQIGRLEDAKEAVGIARDVLRESSDEMRREFAPHLNAALARGLPKITGGRYVDAMVDADLTVRVVVPETGRVERADELSRATKDQIFLVQRLEIARMLAPTKGIAPLFLDDPFAHYDERRLRWGLEIVAEAAAERQIILFSDDRRLIEPARDLCATCAVIELEAPTVGVSA